MAPMTARTSEACRFPVLTGGTGGRTLPQIRHAAPTIAVTRPAPDMSGMIGKMKTAVPAIALLSLAAATRPAAAQSAILPAPPYYAMTPSMPLTPTAQSPVQQQILQNYRSQLQATQRDLLQQNPSGLGRDQLDIAHQLNSYNLPSNPPPAIGSGSSAPPPPPPPFNPAPFSPTGAIAAPPCDAAPPPAAGAALR